MSYSGVDAVFEGLPVLFGDEETFQAYVTNAVRASELLMAGEYVKSAALNIECLTRLLTVFIARQVLREEGPEA